MFGSDATSPSVPSAQKKREANRLAQQKYRKKQKQTFAEIQDYSDSLDRDLLRGEGGRDVLQRDVRTFSSHVAEREHMITRIYEALLKDDKQTLKALVRRGEEHNLELEPNSALADEPAPTVSDNGSVGPPSLSSCSTLDGNFDFNLEQMVPWDLSPSSVWPSSPPVLPWADVAPMTHEPVPSELAREAFTWDDRQIDQLSNFGLVKDLSWMTDLSQGVGWQTQVF